MVTIIYTIIFMLLVDSMYLSTIGNYLFKDMVQTIQHKPLALNVWGVLGSYTSLMILLYVFIFENSPKNKNKLLFKAFLLGFFVYGVFDFTNLALFTDYNIWHGLVDMIWGGTLFVIVTWFWFWIRTFYLS